VADVIDPYRIDPEPVHLVCPHNGERTPCRFVNPFSGERCYVHGPHRVEELLTVKHRGPQPECATHHVDLVPA
jgi:hypothetical protein